VPITARATRDRYVGFAFTAAELLLETDPQGIVQFAAGAFARRFGHGPEHFVGRHASCLIAPDDQAPFALALATAAARGRVAPMLVRLGDAARTCVTLAALRLPGDQPRLCLTLAQAPAALPDPIVRGGREIGSGAGPVARAAALAGPGSDVRLIEVPDWELATASLDDAARQLLRAQIGQVLTDHGDPLAAAEIAEGRFGLVTDHGEDVAAIASRIDQLLAAAAAIAGGRPAKVRGTRLSLAASRLAPLNAARALRYVLSRFAEGGVDAVAECGGDGGLSNVLARAEARTEGLRRTIQSGRFKLLFQPVVSLRPGHAVHHHEALIRPIPTASSPSRSAQEFVCFAEAVGLSELLDMAVLTRASGALAAAPEVSVAVNVSGLSIAAPAFYATALAALDAVAPGRLLFEVTETAEIEDVPAAAAAMAGLRAAGGEMCLDDFGAGAASFRYLRELPVDHVKLDASYVQGAARTPRDRGLVASMVALAGSVGAITAEGIETEAQAALMVELGVDHGQGWLFGRPGALAGFAG